MDSRDEQRRVLANKVAGLLASRKKTGLHPLRGAQHPSVMPDYRGSVIPGNSKRGKRIKSAHKLAPKIKPWIGGGDTGA